MSNQQVEYFEVLPNELLGSAPQPFDSISLANHIGVEHKTLWYCVLAEDTDKYLIKYIPKKTYGQRLIHMPNLELKFVQVRLNRYLNQLQEHLPTCVTAYRPLGTIPNGVLPHIAPCPICDGALNTPSKHQCPRKGAYIQMDLKNFFNYTKRWWVGEMLEKNLGLLNAVAGPIRDIVTVRNIPGGTEKYPDAIRHGVPQGAPTSGAICNLVAYYRMDLPILEHLKSLDEKYNLSPPYSWVYTRYADDLAFTCGRDFAFKEKIQIVQDLIDVVHSTGYRVNKRKVHIRSSQRRKDLLGLNFHDRLTISRAEYLQLRALTHNCLVYGVETQFNSDKYPFQHETPGELLSWLEGKIAYVRHVDPRKGNPLYDEFLAAKERYLSEK